MNNQEHIFTTPSGSKQNASLNYSEKQRLFSQLVKRYYYQLTFGCSNANCENIYCATGRMEKMDAAEATSLSLTLAKTGTEHLCLEDSEIGGISLDNGSILTEDFLVLKLEDLERRIDESRAESNYQKLASHIYAVFSRPENLITSFTKKQIDERLCPVDLETVRKVYKLILQCPEVVVSAMSTGIETMLSSIHPYAQASQQSDKYIACYIISLENPLLMETDAYTGILPKLVECLCALQETTENRMSRESGSIDSLRDKTTHLMSHWISSGYDAETFSRLVAVFQQFITIRLLTGLNSPNKDTLVVKATKALKLLYDANEQSEFINYAEFYNDAINEQLDIKEDFPHWKAKDGFSFCYFSYILNAAVKTDILKVESMVQMRHELQDAFFRAMFAGIQSPYLILEIRRDHIIRDALFQLDLKSPQDLKKQLRVQFVGEEGVDEGGVQKEFFQLVFREMFDQKYGMFRLYEDSNLCWFMNNPEDDEVALDEYRLVGRLIGLAIYNNVILDVHFPLALYKKLLNRPISFQDLLQLDPSMAQGFNQLLNFKESVQEFYDRTFEIEYEIFGNRKCVELKPGGSKISLTNENRKEFVDLYIDFVFNKSVFKQFEAFRGGFESVCKGTAITIFRPEELEQLVCGSSDLDFEALEANTAYDGGYSPDTTVIQWFWEVVHAFSEKEKKLLLFFTTGTDRVPIGGLSKLNFVIARNGPDCDRLPTSHTCFNVLLLNEYSSKEKLRERLLTAIQNAEGFVAAFSADTSCQLNVFWHNGNTLSMDSAKVSIFKQSNEVSFSSFLKSTNSSRLETEISLEVLSNFTNKSLKWQFTDQKFSRFLVTTDFTKSDSSWSVTVSLFDTSSAGCWCRLACSFGCQLFAWSFTTSRFACSLFSTCHLIVGG
ncbi:HECT-domain-containing protein [Rozella allomycis CSF55]|uniref:HECT-type E3 ubiquitin transferase n=1 Tax=Rozella allomycis (strain CSF55) TaxID=988480 RepID=A0A075AQ22_ROZAC|nr:HECT domain-containing protein [Rozella allomycis CSF55]RKP21172.1 HECT-domain-containing protein [Rozella allomycis CSF55]|eukprot:EPZ32224.1 HECT domain-containing protein [Rozella allomycis CSF55]